MDDLPFISREDFARACEALVQRLKKHGVDCTYIEKDNHQCFILRRSVKDQAPDMERTHYVGHPPPTEEEEKQAEIEEGFSEEDEVSVSRVPPLHPWTVSTEYHILLSDTYRVPVLYFQTLYPLSTSEGPSVRHVLEHLVPPSYRDQIESVGVMGAVSVTHHPIHGLTYYTVHPCNTADALREVLADRTPSPVEYLQVWLGLVGPSVGLQLPAEAAVAEGQ